MQAIVHTILPIFEQRIQIHVCINSFHEQKKDSSFKTGYTFPDIVRPGSTEPTCKKKYHRNSAERAFEFVQTQSWSLMNKIHYRNDSHYTRGFSHNHGSMTHLRTWCVYCAGCVVCTQYSRSRTINVYE